MNALELRLQQLNAGLLSKFHETLTKVELLLSKYDYNFPTYTDHSINHTKEVFKITSDLLISEEIENLNEDEIYILSMACILHDVGMCIPEEKFEEINKSTKYKDYRDSNPTQSKEDFIRDIHHELSYDFILTEYRNLKIPNENYAEAIALVAKGHRKVALDDTEIYAPKKFVKSGRDFVCLPYLASILRLADEFDITNIRTPKLLTKYYMPNNEKSINEWQKHISTTQINYTEDKVIFKVTCSDQNNLAALDEQFEKIQNVSNYCQKIIRTISNTENRRFKLKIIRVVPEYKFIGFDPKGIKFSFNVQNVVKTFIGEDLYEDDLASIRETLQNSIDSCRYKQSILSNRYKPKIKIIIDNAFIKIIDNGLGMDEFIIENFFGRLGSSFYEQEKIKKGFEAIGQFGVGIFSYFLLSEYIDIETKTENGNPLKFRIDKDPKNYFHFYNETDRTETGTTITLYLKKEIQSKYNFSDYVKYIKKVFRHIEFAIYIEGDKNFFVLKSSPIICDSDEEIKKKIKIQYKDNAGKFQAIKYSICNEEYEGECAIIINKFSKKYILKNIASKFDHDSFMTVDQMHGSSQISISQRGVFVNNYSSGYLGMTVGNINLKKSKKISINRRGFSDSESILGIIDVFMAGLIENLFKELKSRYAIELLTKISDEFLTSYMSSFFSEKRNFSRLICALEESIFIEMYTGGGQKIIPLKELNATVDKFILISNLENKKIIYNTTNLPIVTASGYRYEGSYHCMREIFVSLLKYTPSILISNNKGYQKLDKSNYQEYLVKRKKFEVFQTFRIDEFEEFDSKLLTVKVSKNKKELKKLGQFYSDTIINVRHPYIEYLLRNFDKIKMEDDFVKIIKSSFEIISDISDSKRVLVKNLTQLNQILIPLTKIEEPWCFSKVDFQINEN